MEIAAQCVARRTPIRSEDIMIHQRNLSLLSNRLARKGGRRIPEAANDLNLRTAMFLLVDAFPLYIVHVAS